MTPGRCAAGATRAPTGSVRLLARSREVRLFSGACLRTPLLVPSISSRGFGLAGDGFSEAAQQLDVARDHISEALLISAYDLHHRLLPDVDELLSDAHWSTLYAVPQLLVIDSGGYELAPAWDGNEVYREPREPREFTEAEYEDVLDRLPRDRDLLVVTYDHVPPGATYPPYDDQVTRAMHHFERRDHLMVDLLIKPQQDRRFVDVSDVASVAASLGVFHAVGVTEKELGDSLLDRLVAVARLRMVLDDADVTAPVHVFGALSPLHVGLYFMAGAEVFDGLDWLRYGHHGGLSVQRETAALLWGLTDEGAGVRHGLVTLDYLDALRVLKRRLCNWAETRGDFRVMEQWVDVYESTYAAMLARLSEKG